VHIDIANNLPEVTINTNNTTVVCPFVLFLLDIGCLSFDLGILITPLVSSNAFYLKEIVLFT
jgi:hypothetical protein